jgi:hypothetical protein
MQPPRNECSYSTRSAIGALQSACTSALLWSCCFGVMGGVVPSEVAAQAQSTNDVTLTTSSGTTVRIPSRGPLSNDAADEAAHDVLAIDRQLKPFKDGKPSGKSDVLVAMQKIALDARNDAVDSLDLAYRVARMTSGVLDSEQINSAKQNVQIAKDILKATPPPRLYVRTAISSTVANAALHYRTAADYKKKVGSWSSYTPGETLRIGRYVFRLDAATGGEPYQELVLVLSDPTEKMISPLP